MGVCLGSAVVLYDGPAEHGSQTSHVGPSLLLGEDASLSLWYHLQVDGRCAALH